MKIVVTGTRGIPSIQGGVETHCEELFPRIVSMGGDVVLLRRASYVEKDSANDVRAFKGVGLIDLPTPRRKSFEAIIHTFRAVVEAKRQKADIVHIHAVGPALLVPVAKMLGLKVVMTNHGPDYEREKWGKAAKAMLRLGERLGAKYADAVIVISEHIRRRLAERYGRTDADLIFNGVPVLEKDAGTDYTDSLGLQPGRYVVAIGRFVKEKNFHLLIDAFSRVAPEGIRLVIAGDADMPDDYSESLKRQAKDAGMVLTGFIKGRKLRQLMSHARLFVLPSTHEGLPISLLEAMSYGLDVLVSDIDANTLPQLDGTDFFRVGDIDDLCASLSRKLSCASSGRVYDLSDYDWDIIAGKTMDVYRRVCGE